MGMPEFFIQMVRILFQDAKSVVVVNNKLSPSFPIERRMRLGYSLVPYLFLLVVETLNMAAKATITTGTFQGIRLPNSKDRQLLPHFADDTTVGRKGEELYLQNLVNLLQVFAQASGLHINWEKSMAY
jgi:hypothetical protein